MASRGAAKKAPPRKKKGGYKMPPPIPSGEVLADVTGKKKWRIGPSIGVGGFGEIYSACDDTTPPKSSANYPYAVKIEPHENGPLFCEKNFYTRNINKDDKIGKDWREEHSIKLIELYKKHRNLWDPTDSDYKVVSKRADSWNEIANIMKTDVNELKRKMATLTSTYRRTHQKVKSTKQDEEYIPTWFAYKHLDFLSTRYLDKYNAEEQTSEHEEEKEPVERSSDDESSRSSDQTGETASHSGGESVQSSRKRKSDNSYDIQAPSTNRDEFDVYGEYIAHVLRNLDSYSMHCVQKVFSDVIFHARMGRYLNAKEDAVQNCDSNLDSNTNGEVRESQSTES